MLSHLKKNIPAVPSHSLLRWSVSWGALKSWNCENLEIATDIRSQKLLAWRCVQRFLMTANTDLPTKLPKIVHDCWLLLSLSWCLNPSFGRAPISLKNIDIFALLSNTDAMNPRKKKRWATAQRNPLSCFQKFLTSCRLFRSSDRNPNPFYPLISCNRTLIQNYVAKKRNFSKKCTDNM